MRAVLLFVGPLEGEIDVGEVEEDIFSHVFGSEVLSLSLALADTWENIHNMETYGEICMVFGIQRRSAAFGRAEHSQRFCFLSNERL